MGGFRFWLHVVMARFFLPRAAAAVLLALVACGALAPAASAAPAPTLSKTTVQRGEAFTVSGTGCVNPVDPVEAWNTPTIIVFGGAFSGGGQVAVGGNWSVSVDVGGHLGPGSFPIRAHCQSPGSGDFDYPTVTVTVVGEPLPPKPWETPQRPGGYTSGVPASPPAAQPTIPRTTTPRTTTAPGTTTRTTAPPSTPAPDPLSTVAASSPAPPSFVAASRCTDCERLTGDETLTAGSDLTLSYAGFQPGEQVTLVMRSTPVDLGTFTADAAGIVTAAVTLPASADAGAHTLTFSGPATGDHVVRFRLAAAPEVQKTVAAPTPTGTDLTLPLVLGGAVAVLVLGGGLVLHRRRAARPAEAAQPESPGQPTETPIAEPIA
jgi:hypothetical protein